MKKYTTLIILVIVITSLTIYAKENKIYEAYESDVKIIFNGEETRFNLPVVTIDGRTYVSLREVTENAGIRLEWDGEVNEIALVGNLYEYDAEKIFELLFGFALPDTSQVLNYDYYLNNIEQAFIAKIVFNKGDLEYIKNNLTESMGYIGSWTLSYCSRNYSWWDLSDINDSVFVYTGNLEAITRKSPVAVSLHVTEYSEDQYCLYAIFI